MNNTTDKVIVGRLGAAYGIKGWLHLTSFTSPPDNIFQYQNWHLKQHDQWTPIVVSNHKPHGNAFIIQLKNIDDRDQAMQLKGVEIAVDRNQLPATSKDEYYWSDLIGLTVLDTTGKELGVIDYLFETGSNDVIVTKGSKPQFIPYIDDVIKHVNLDEQTITVDWEPIA